MHAEEEAAETALPPGLEPVHVLDDQAIAAVNEELERRRLRRLELPLVDLVEDFPKGAIIPGVGKALRPYHLLPFAERLEAAMRGERERVLVSAPPQHSKTSLILYALARGLARNPSLRVGYVSYAAGIAIERSIMARDVAIALGCRLRVGQNAGSLWKTESGGMFIAGGIGGQFAGRGLDVIAFDDPYKDPTQAASATHRAKAEDLIKAILLPRLAPGGSMFLSTTRWHADDVIGRRAKDKDWTYLNFEAICDDPESDPIHRKAGEALWPEFKPVEFFVEARKDIYEWASLYQGHPRPRDGALFGLASFYPDDEPLPSGPDVRVRVICGIDLAYSEKTQSDWSVAVLLARIDHLGEFNDDGRRKVLRSEARVLDMLRLQVKQPVFCARLKEFVPPGVPCFMYFFGTETGSIDHMSRQGVRVALLKKPGDKYSRAQNCAAAWNDGRVTVPRGTRLWVSDLVDEVCAFTGSQSAHDDIVDALVAAYDAAGFPRSVVVQTPSPPNPMDVYAGGRERVERGVEPSNAPWIGGIVTHPGATWGAGRAF